MDTLTVDLPSIEESEYAKRYGVRIGSGAYRNVYRIKGSRWVYKFEHGAGWSRGNGCNKREFRNFSEKRSTLPEKVDFPEMVLLDNGAIAVEFVNGILGRESHRYDRPCVCPSHGIPECWSTMIQPVSDAGMQDLHGSNVMISREDCKVYIIDIGEYESW